MAFNILIVDDSAVMRAMIARTLALSGLPVGELHQAPDGREGIASLREHWIDLILLDLNMPVMGGEAMIAEIARDPLLSAVPIIVVSSDGSAARQQRLIEQGVQFVLKPFTPEKLRDTVLATLNVTHDGLTYSGAASGDNFDF